MWHTLAREFKVFKIAGSVNPNNVTFNANNKYTLNVSLDKAHITDFDPSADTSKIFDNFFKVVTKTLGITVLTRIGTRFQFFLPFPTIEEARAFARSLSFATMPRSKLFNVEPVNVTSVYKVDVDDGEVGYTAQLYTLERNFDFSPAPEVATMEIKIPKKSVAELVLDLDFLTKKPMPVESFRAVDWLSGWQRAVNRDCQELLDLVSRPHG